jgi:chromosome segregation ATPase
MYASKKPTGFASRRGRFGAMLAALLVMMPGTVCLAADKPGDRERAALSRAQEALRKVEREKAALAQENKTLQEQQQKVVQDEQAKAQAAQSALKAAQRSALASERSLAVSRKAAEEKTSELEGLRKEKTQLTADVEALRAQVEKLTAEKNAAIGTIQTRDADLGKLRTVAQARARVLAVCEEKNTKLYQVGVELIERYENRNLWSSVTTAEPFTRQKRVDLENLMESYRDKLRAERITALPGQ